MTRPVQVRYAKSVARYRVERGAVRLTDGSALATLRVGTSDWLIGEILADRGEAVVLEPEDVRPRDREAGGAAAPRASAQPRPSVAGSLGPAQPTGRVSVKVEPSPGRDSTASEPPWASANERERKSPRPVPGLALPAARPNFSKISDLMLREDPRPVVARRGP